MLGKPKKKSSEDPRKLNAAEATRPSGLIQTVPLQDDFLSSLNSLQLEDFTFFKMKSDVKTSMETMWNNICLVVRRDAKFLPQDTPGENDSILQCKCTNSMQGLALPAKAPFASQYEFES